MENSLFAPLNLFRNRTFFVVLAFLFLCGILSPAAKAQKSELPLPSTAESYPVVDNDRLNQIYNDLQELKALQNQLKSELEGSDETDAEELNEKLTQISQNRREYQRLFEQLALGNIDTARLKKPLTDDEPLIESYNWQNEILKILQPVFKELQNLTEKTRHKETLKEQKEELNERLQLVDFGLTYIESLESESLQSEVREALDDVKSEWQTRQKNMTQELEITTFQLNKYTEQQSFQNRILHNIVNFLTGRGLVLFFASFIAFGLYYLVSFIFNYFIHYYEKKKWRTTSFLFRLFILLTQLATFFISLSAFLLIIHSSGDTLLFGFSILILFSLLIMFRGMIPAYITKLRLFLNLGTLREKERLLYNGLPWFVDKIHLYGIYLTNPSLENGELYLSHNALTGIQSRKLKVKEKWFPTQTNDWVLLPDARLVTIIKQTPESVHLLYKESEILYNTAEFFNLKVMNLSQGYERTINFTLTAQETGESTQTEENEKVKRSTLPPTGKMLQHIRRHIMTQLTKQKEVIPIEETQIMLRLEQFISQTSRRYQLIFTAERGEVHHYHESTVWLQEGLFDYLESTKEKENPLTLTDITVD